MAQLQTTVKIWLLLFAVCSSGSALRRGDVRHEEEFKSVDGWMNGVSPRILKSLERQGVRPACFRRPCYQMALSQQKTKAQIWLTYKNSMAHFAVAKGKKGRGSRRTLDISTTSREKSRGFRPPRSKADKKLERRLRRCILGGLARRCNIPPQRRIRYAGRTYFRPRPRPQRPFSFGDPKVLRCVSNVVRRCARREGFNKFAVTKVVGPGTAGPPPSIETVRPTPVVETVVPNPVVETIVPNPVVETVVPNPVVETVVPTPVVEPPLPVCNRTERVIRPTPPCREEPIVRG